MVVDSLRALRIIDRSAALLLAAILLLAGQPWASGSVAAAVGGFLLAAIFWALNYCPFFLLSLCARKISQPNLLRILAGTALLMFGFTLYSLLNTFFIGRPDAQGGLIFIGLPMLLLPASVIIALVCLSLDTRTPKS
jgi:hypothetical protein